MADEIRREVSQKGEKKAPVTENKGEDHAAGQAEAKEAAAPKKKNLAFVIRPQNSRNSSRIQGNRPAQRRPVRDSREAARDREEQAHVRHMVHVRPERDRYALNARHMVHVLQLRADRLRRQDR